MPSRHARLHFRAVQGQGYTGESKPCASLLPFTLPRSSVLSGPCHSRPRSTTGTVHLVSCDQNHLPGFLNLKKAVFVKQRKSFTPPAVLTNLYNKLYLAKGLGELHPQLCGKTKAEHNRGPVPAIRTPSDSMRQKAIKPLGCRAFCC